jgi:uncharacterized protein (DUF2062 family)
MIQRFLHNLILKESRIDVLASSCAMGAFIAFSPFLGLHTLMAFLFSWMFSLNCIVVLAASNFINNPWTMIPVYSSGYFVGEWILSGWLGLDTMALNPQWMSSLNESLYSIIGTKGVSCWSFLIGGNLLGLVVAGMLYPVSKRVFARLIQQKK